MKYFLGKKTTFLLILAACLFALSLIIFYYNNQKLILTGKLMDHTQNALRISDDVLIEIINIETSTRGYLITGNPIFLEPYNKASISISNSIKTLGELTSDNLIQKLRIDTLKNLVEERLAFTKELVGRWKGFNASEITKVLGDGKIKTDKIRGIIAKINSEEFAILQLRKTEAETNTKSSRFILLFLLLCVLTIFILLIVIIRNEKLRNTISKELEAITTSQKLLSKYSLSLIEASLDPLVTITTDGKITDMNEALVNITGIDREKLRGTDFFNYFTEPDKARDVYKEVFATINIAGSPLTLRHVNGKLTEVLFNGSIYKDDKGNVLGAVIVARDVAEQKWAKDLRIANKELAFQNDEKEKRAAELIIANKELAFQNDEKEKRAAELIIANKELAYQNEEKEKRANELIIANKELEFQNEEKVKRAAELRNANYARSLIEASHDPLVTINIDGKITDMNQALANITGLTRDELKGTDFFDYFTEPQKAREVYQVVFANGSVADSPLTLINKDGKLTDVLFNGSVYKNDKGSVLGVVIVARDVTDQKRIETELTEAMVFAELATGIAEDAKIKAESATKIAENAVKTKQQFLSNMSHEIRTPMNAIIGFTKVILKTELTLKQKEYLTAIKISGDALIVLINDILDLAKVEAGKMTFEQIPFKMMLSISAMLHLFETKIQEKNLQLIKEYDSNIPEVLLGDPVRLHQIILNLVSNAVKFTSRGKITVRVKLLKEEDDKVFIEFSIKDTGIGIPSNKIDKIFENFQQASSGTSRLYGGTGLGLAIVKQLVEPQGGTITCVSILNEGSTFSFILPFQKTNEEAELLQGAVEFESDVKNIKVLVAEDIALNQLLMETLLDEFGFEHEIASNGRIAIEKLKNKAYDIILMDLQMPELNGFETTEYIRNTLKSNIPIIALTADVTTADLKKCKAVGMNDYIAKPVDERLLYKKIIELLSKPVVSSENEIISPQENTELNSITPIKCIDLNYLNLKTKSDPVLMMKMIQLYLVQTPPLVSKMVESMGNSDWASLSSSAHKMIPSFSIVGIHKDFEHMTAKIQEYSGLAEHIGELKELITKVEHVCSQACEELIIEYNIIKAKN